MDKRTTDTLARFCIEQSVLFNSRDWLFIGNVDAKLVALVAKYLSMTSWYGHEEDLEAIARGIQTFEGDSAGLYRESRLLDFDLPYFSTAVRAGITRARVSAQWQGATARRSRRRFERGETITP